MNVDWSKAPEWAVAHALFAFCGELSEVWVGEDKWQRLDQPKSFPYGGGVGDSRHNPTRARFSYETPRPTPWTGEGLPPVGTVCDGLDGCNRWHKCRIVHHSLGDKPKALAATGDDEAGLGIFHAFRPIRTPEQIAAEARGSAVKELMRLWMDGDPEESLESAMARIYDAGYHKPDL